MSNNWKCFSFENRKQIKVQKWEKYQWATQNEPSYIHYYNSILKAKLIIDPLIFFIIYYLL